MKKLNKIISYLLLLLVVLYIPSAVFAKGEQSFDENAVCNLDIIIENENDKNIPVANADVTLFRVADAVVSNDKVTYPCTDDFSGYAVSIDNFEDDKQAEDIFDYAIQHRVEGTTQYTDKSGRTQFAGLKPGVYLVSEIKGVTDKYVKFKPFLVVLPYETEGQLIYNVLAKPKFETEGADRGKSISVKKVWNDDGKDRPKSVKIQLLKDRNVYDTVELNQSNSWNYSWNDMDGSANWSVKEVEVPKGYTVTYTKNGLNFTVNNSRKLVQTGQLKWPVPVLAVTGIIFILTGMLIKRGKGKKEDE